MNIVVCAHEIMLLNMHGAVKNMACGIEKNSNTMTGYLYVQIM